MLKKKKKHFKLSLLIVWIALSIVNTYSKFQVNIFSNNRDITKCQKFLHIDNNDDEDDNDAKAIAICRVISENNRAKKQRRLSPS